MTPEEYQALVKRMAPRSPILRDTALAFLVGGAICVVGQLLSHWYGTLGLDDSDAGTATSVTLVFLSALATGLGLYHKLARWAGAGTLVPITGFANAVASPAVDFQAEGLITGTAVKMFTVAGPVIVFGTAASVVYGLVLWLVQLALYVFPIQFTGRAITPFLNSMFISLNDYLPMLASILVAARGGVHS